MAFGRLGTFGTGYGRLGHAPRTPWWLSGSSLDMDFAKNRARQAGRFYAPSALLTTTRASDAYSDDTAGRWSLFASGAPRITDKGLLVEEARTNSIRNNSMQGAVAGTPGTLPTNWGLNGTANGLTREIVGVGTENGVDYIDVRWFGTASAQIDIAIRPEATTTQVAAASGQSWTASAFFKLVTGANPFSITNFYVLGINSGGSATADTAVTSVTLNGTLTRRSVSITMADATTAAALFTTIFRIPNGTVCDFTLRIGWPQLELGAFATSPIRTTAAAATRAADAITTALAGTSEGAIVVYARTAPGLATQLLAQWDDGTASNRIYFYRPSGGNIFAQVVAGGANQAILDLGIVANSTDFKVGLSWKANDFVAVLNGGTPLTDVSGSVPTGLTTFRHGASTAGNQWNSTTSREAIFPIRLTNAQLQVLTQ